MIVRYHLGASWYHSCFVFKTANTSKASLTKEDCHCMPPETPRVAVNYVAVEESDSGSFRISGCEDRFFCH